MRKYKFFDSDIVKFKSRRRKKIKSNNKSIVMYYKVIKDPENILTADELLPWEVYENTINRCWDWNKLTKVKTKYSNNIFDYYLFKLYKNRRIK